QARALWRAARGHYSAPCSRRGTSARREGRLHRQGPPRHRELALVLLALELDRERLDRRGERAARERDVRDLGVALAEDVQAPLRGIHLSGRERVLALGH